MMLFTGGTVVTMEPQIGDLERGDVLLPEPAEAMIR
ncbi:hypothetical protein FHR38_004478 [Micromonospora polyrhachis]|uniref:Uncharacterized protein n=1 Tax=Micromonospora polyrhachis TaxID=1282883 RepID=A0A7W7STJ6_9ACTN|nr:hypothetical protein [Micromonospora polyrhachis]